MARQVSVVALPLCGTILEGEIVTSLIVELVTWLKVALQACVTEGLLPDPSHVWLAEDFRRLGLLCPSQHVRTLGTVCIVLALQQHGALCLLHTNV